MQASGWPNRCKTNEDKAAYIQEVKRKEVIQLQKEKVEVNPLTSSLTSIAKLMLSSFWGKFGMRDNLTQTHYIQKPEEF